MAHHSLVTAMQKTTARARCFSLSKRTMYPDVTTTTAAAAAVYRAEMPGVKVPPSATATLGQSVKHYPHAQLLMSKTLHET